ncbi:exopolysaccharide production repressor protein [Mesorhizobium sp.]|uniref:exopolysaccharide production repressor protein n=1 Tax=Mesorhizobium sp. TaxID=1871066 RepID=UPI000FE35387|nr:exopolysaccharide production repressor protein [Mesorhizobium sp.]RWA70962.1 MAG: exopolysaccharide production repressor protein exox [Mesorhizobium sp.]RWB99292.1 MAG: exopolysaccharide production repressor protein exox [Mesorhizobium sp.]RWG81674.1 MAG: exopolysaccharide production repressor protein exox [Mesorhizobium sp.]RWG83313.1 MAG: exopolysaccharide production repressor protein exox [Mesorhizobium sp.]RWK08178.1 MAG: exopolysaccharide production repressor protein exox [Mesorhizobiu
MSFLLFLRGLIIVLLAFAISTYLLTGSLWSTIVQTAICGILIQIGYFVAVLLLVWRSVSEESEIPKSHITRDEPDREQHPRHLGNNSDHFPPRGGRSAG